MESPCFRKAGVSGSMIQGGRPWLPNYSLTKHRLRAGLDELCQLSTPTQVNLFMRRLIQCSTSTPVIPPIANTPSTRSGGTAAALKGFEMYCPMVRPRVNLRNAELGAGRSDASNLHSFGILRRPLRRQREHHAGRRQVPLSCAVKANLLYYRSWYVQMIPLDPYVIGYIKSFFAGQILR